MNAHKKTAVDALQPRASKSEPAIPDIRSGTFFEERNFVTQNQCTQIAKQRLIENGWACGGALTLKVISLARNRVISSVRFQRHKGRIVYGEFKKQ